MPNILDLENWTEFRDQVGKLSEYRQSLVENDKYSSVDALLFRGHSDAQWKLQTTLERYSPAIRTWSDYFRIASGARTEIESLTDRRWTLPDFPEMAQWAEKSSSPWRSGIPGYDYLVYLRHHGFPSPLLDWSRSPYVAAFFAFRSEHDATRVAIYAYLQDIGSGKSGLGSEPMIHSQGRYVTAHARHVRQQCEYTICTRFEESLLIAAHEDVFARNDGEQDLLWKFTLPASERLKVLRELDSYNLNAFSLFQTEDCLLETAALREIHFSGHYDNDPSRKSS